MSLPTPSVLPPPLPPPPPPISSLPHRRVFERILRLLVGLGMVVISGLVAAAAELALAGGATRRGLHAWSEATAWSAFWATLALPLTFLSLRYAYERLRRVWFHRRWRLMPVAELHTRPDVFVAALGIWFVWALATSARTALAALGAANIEREEAAGDDSEPWQWNEPLRWTHALLPACLAVAGTFAAQADKPAAAGSLIRAALIDSAALAGILAALLGAPPPHPGTGSVSPQPWFVALGACLRVAVYLIIVSCLEVLQNADVRLAYDEYEDAPPVTPSSSSSSSSARVSSSLYERRLPARTHRRDALLLDKEPATGVVDENLDDDDDNNNRNPESRDWLFVGSTSVAQTAWLLTAGAAHAWALLVVVFFLGAIIISNVLGRRHANRFFTHGFDRLMLTGSHEGGTAAAAATPTAPPTTAPADLPTTTTLPEELIDVTGMTQMDDVSLV